MSGAPTPCRGPIHPAKRPALLTALIPTRQLENYFLAPARGPNQVGILKLRLVMGVSSVLFPLLTMQTVMGILPHPTLPDNPSGAQAEAFFEEWYGVQQAQTLFHILGMIWFGVFVLGLYLTLRNVEPAPAFWSRLALWSGMAAVVMKVAVMTFVSGAISLFGAPNYDADGAVVLAMYFAGWYAYALIVYFMPFFFAGVAVVVLKHKALPAWIGWFAVVAGVLSIAGIVSVVDQRVGWLPYPMFMLLMVWTLATGIYCLVTARQDVPRPAAATVG